MNKFLSLGGVFVAAALLSGCSDNELASVETSEMNAIGFHVVGSQAETKAIPTTPSNLTLTDFKVFAFKGNENYMGGTSEGLGHMGVHIEHNGTAWDYADPTDRHYWPSEPLNFYAVNPATFDEHLMTHYGWIINHNTKEIHYTCTDEYNTGHNNIDVMYAIAEGKTKDSNKGKVSLQFKHILSQVVFQAKTNNTNLAVEINKILIHNVNGRGTFTFPADATTVPAQSNWDRSIRSAQDDFTVVKEKSIIVDNATTATKISVDSPMLFVPQPLTAWNTSHPIAQADTDKESYLEIKCKIQQSGSYLFGTASTYDTLYVPFSADWQPGKRYIYTLIFGGGYDNQGKPILTPIDFEANVDDWGPESGDVNL